MIKCLVRRLRSIAAISLISPALVFTTSAQAHTELTIVNYGGAQARSMMMAYVLPYEELKGVHVEMDEYNGGIEELRDQVDSTNVRWHAIDMEYSDLIRACDEGLLEEIDHSFLAPGPDGTPASEDFVEGSLTKCGVGSVIWATVMAYKRGAFAKTGATPSRIADFFNVRKFPGRRGLRKDPRGTLEWALMGDGVPADQVYEVLSTPEGVNRAFAVLDSIKSSIVWWTRGPEPAQFLVDGTVVMTAAWNGRLYRPIVEKLAPIEILWDAQLWEIEFWGIPKSPRGDSSIRAIDFIRFATKSEQLANQAKYIPYGPVRRSAMEMVDSSVRSYLPTYGPNMSNALRFNSQWWADNIDEIRARFDQWAKPAYGDVQERGSRF